ncbi:hypothetical protein J7J49_07285 [Halomonas sp. ISL-56]|uniref:hypothetical protein n=1 Tax=Halomonas sp. ISL-56 TaxID=2819149 RepID=UPI001BEA92DE|nr:hypothetical protein [Halomonas sp. ISL-56]MBT2801123.1 hypothetical protein [Halomonas sp. ISL-56]
MSQQQHPVAPHASKDLGIKPSINTLAQGSMFWQPDYREASPWLEHLPFLFWLVEALRPQQAVGLGVDSVAHFAVCQAASRLRLGTRCFMVGGHETPAGKQDAEAIRAYAADHFATISQWLEATPTRAIDQFDDSSVDLLLLHVEADDNSVDYLLDRWLSKLSSQGVVVVPGVSRREPGCLVFRAFETLKARYPHFVFHHAGGLGVIAVGNDLPPLLKNLLGALESVASTQVVQDVFARLGRSCQDKVTVRYQQALSQALEARVNEQASNLATAEQRVQDQSEQLQRVGEEREKLKVRLEQQESRFAQERGRLAERVSSLEEFNDELKKELMRQREQGERQAVEAREQSERQANEAREQRERYAAESHEYAQALKTSEQSLNQAQHEVEEHKRMLETRFGELAKLTSLLESNEKSLRSAHDENTGLTNKLQKTESSLQARFNELGQLTRKLQEADQRIGDVEKNRADLEQQLAQQKKAHSELSAQLKAANEREKEALNAVDERFRELAVITDLLEKNEAQRERLQRELEDTKAANQKLELDAKARQETQQQHEREIKRQSHELAELVKQLEAQRAPSLPEVAAPQVESPVQNSVAKAPPLTKRAIKRQVALIEKSQWFDAKWYLAQYPDIARDSKMSADPARHYLLMGGFEGRDPCPDFNSAYYLEHNPDVVQSGINPLVHYIKFGEKEQRSTKK